MDDPLYREEILDHYYSSPYRGRLERPDHVCDLDNPFCGDQIHVELTVADDRIREVRFDGKGCVISQAAASLLAERLEGATVAEAAGLGPNDVVALLGIPLTPTRIKCAILGLRAVLKALETGSATA